jgi:hypothetical protein
MKKLFIDDPRISNVVFYPRKIKIPEEMSPNVKALKFQISEEILIGGFCYIKDKNLPTILLFHGNGEIASDYQHSAPIYFNYGVNLAVADFRGYGFSTGNPVYSGLINDAYPIFQIFKDWMAENGFKNSLFVQGRSMGSVCAAEIGSHDPEDLKGIIFESGFASLYDMMTRVFGVGGPDITPEALSEFSNDTRIKKCHKPVLIIHGTLDMIIPNEQARLIHDAIPEGVDKELVMIKGAGHNDISFHEKEYFIPLKKFIEKYK